MSTSLAWDDRYQNGGFEFGEAPNLYLQSQAHRLRPGLRALAVGDGEGRNGVWLAGQGLQVTSVDWSGVGLAKAASLARQRGVALQTITADVAAWDWPRAQFDLIAWIFVHLPPEDRARATQGALVRSPPAACWSWNASPPRRKGAAAAGRSCANCSGAA